ncbi:MAG: hypothetical protein EON50_07100 [Acidovorax sp.]|nr:MAG: hypothetical protein EON50_07100 [Acidovorax sp.]
MPSTTTPVPALHIQASTLVTSLGDDLQTTLSAYTARRKNFRYREVDGAKLIAAPAGDITHSLQGLPRLNALVQAAWQPMVQILRDRPPCPTLFMLVLPQWVASEPAAPASDASSVATPSLQSIENAFSARCRQLDLPMSDVQAVAGGAEACHVALAQAFRWLAPEPAARQIVMLAADSLCEPTILLGDYRAKRLYNKEQSSGWVPGEAAAGILLTPQPHLETARDALQAGLLLYPPGLGGEPEQCPRWPSDMQGDGRILSDAIGAALQAAQTRPELIQHHASDSDGSFWRLEDEQHAVDRILSVARDPQKTQWMPEAFQAAELLGQVGAAWGAVNWALLHGLHQHELINPGLALCTSQDVSGRCSANVLALGSH